jgi:CHAT domain-containing protein
LPHARTEARQALRALRGQGELRLGPDASEAFVKQADLGSYRVVHMAAHALLDEANPSRSAILLAPGDAREDGLLQAREVIDLDLGGAVIMLSACRSAGGTAIAGEGVMGLARAFFQARAGVVVGGLWPLRDRDTARLMDAYYRHLGAGRPVATALAEAKRERIRAGAPASEWAGLVVLGAGSREPWPDMGVAAPAVPRPLLVALVVLVAGGALILLLRLRRAAR